MPLVKRKQKKAPTLDRKFDTKYLGEEPTFEITPLDPKERRVATMRAFGWYNYFFLSKHHRKFMVQFAKERLSLNKDEVRAVRDAGDNAFRPPVEKYVRMALRGWVLDDREINLIMDDYKKVIREFTPSKEETVERVKLAPQVNSPLLAALDDLEDQWILGVKEDFNLFEKQQILNDTKGNLNKHVRPWIEGRLQDMYDHRDRDEQCKEAYPFGARERNRRIKVLEQMLTDLDLVTATKKRVVRAKKPATAEKQTQNFKHLKESNEFKISSIDPAQIIGATRVYMFDTQHRMIHEVVTSEPKGFGVKGMAITGFDPKATRKIKLRKPEEFLPIVLKKNPNMINKEWSNLTTKESESNGRTNKNMILLRVVK